MKNNITLAFSADLIYNIHSRIHLHNRKGERYDDDTGTGDTTDTAASR